MNPAVDSLRTQITHNHHLHIPFNAMHLSFFGFAAVLIIALVIWQIGWLKDAFSEWDEKSGKLIASKKGIVGAMFAFTICICEVFHTVKQQEFDYQHLVALLVTICLLYGIATVPQILQAWKGGGNTPPAKDPTT